MPKKQKVRFHKGDRKPAKTMRKKLSYKTEMEKEGKMRVQVHTTVQLYNILDLTDLFEYVDQFGYFIVCNGSDETNEFNGIMKFDELIVPYELDDSWIPKK